MKEKQTEDSLGVFWEGEETDGLLVYAYFSNINAATPFFPANLWPPGTKIAPWTFTSLEDASIQWTVFQWTVVLDCLPKAEAWEETVKQTLMNITKQGAIVAWCGLEGGFADPPSLFSPQQMPDSVWAAYSNQLGFIMHARLGCPFKPFSNAELENLRALVRVFWDSSISNEAEDI